MSDDVAALPASHETVADGSEPAAIEFRNVSLIFDGAPALRDVSFVLRRGQMICVTGASGSGKSVLLRLAIGLLQPDRGQIFVEGREIENLSEEELLAIRGGLMGIVFQDESLFTGLNVYDNAAYRLAEHGWSEEDIDRAVREALTFVGLEGDADKLPGELSGGMKRRLEIARALIGWPPIMLFDEPTSGLDPLNEAQVLDLIILARDLHRISSLFVTKQLHQIPYLAAHTAAGGGGASVPLDEAGAPRAPDLKVLFLSEGEVTFFGTPDEFFRDTSPDVVYMTRAQEVSRTARAWVADPWLRGRNSKGAAQRV